jgi:hypothetical protein
MLLTSMKLHLQVNVSILYFIDIAIKNRGEKIAIMQ